MSASVEAAREPSVPVSSGTSRAYGTARLLYWSIRRELWENRSIYFAPLGVAVVMLLGFVIGARRLADAMRAASLLEPAERGALIAKPFGVAAIPIIVTVSIVAIFYCLEALHAERRDRSILFWKSLPVPDVVTVLAKALIPLLVLPAIACATFIVLQTIILIVGTGVLQASGLDGSLLWAGLPLARIWGGLIYTVFGLALWHAPIYGWLLLVSGWARRSTFLWAILPPLALCLVEKIAFDTGFALAALKNRLFGFAFQGFVFEERGRHVPDPLALLASPGLWIGLVVATLFLGAAVWFRRYRQPI